MTQPFLRSSGVYQLNARVPTDLLGRVRGTAIVLPLDGGLVTVKASDKVILSLRTRERGVAVERCVEAFSALCRHFAAVRAGPKALSHRQVVALAGDAYRERTGRADEFDPETLHAQKRERERDTAAWRYGGPDDPGEISEDAARLFEASSRPWGPQLLALERGGDVDEPPYVRITYL